MVAEFQVEVTGPSLALFMQSVHRMMIDVNLAKAAANKIIFMRVQGLKDLVEAVLSEDECLRSLSFFALPIPSPVRLALARYFMPVVSEVPVSQKKSKDCVLRRDVSR